MILIGVLIAVALIVEIIRLERKIKANEKMIQIILNDFDMHTFYGERRH